MSACGENHGHPREETISREDLAALLEYSCSLPTGTTIGKRWRRSTHWPKYLETTEWRIGSYVDCPCMGEGRVAIAWAWAIGDDGNPHRGELR